MWELIGLLFASAVSLFFLTASHSISDRVTTERQHEYFSKETAQRWVTFGSALERYAEDNDSSLPEGDTVVTCTILKNDGYLASSFPCTDPLGQELRGLIAKPIGVLQSIIVYPATSASVDIYTKLKLKTSLNQKSFLLRIATVAKDLNSRYEFVALKRDGTFSAVFSKSIDNIKDYTSSGSVPAVFLQGYDYAPVMFVKGAKGVGYWVWSVQETSTGIAFYNQGFSYACPTPRGLPKDPPNSSWTFNPMQPWSWNWSGVISNTVMSTYICIPATEQTVLNNPGASIPSLSVKITQSFLNAYIENKTDAEGDYVVWPAADCGGASYMGVVEIRIGSRVYTVYAWQNVCANVKDSSGTVYGGGGAIPTHLLFVKGSPPATFCVDLASLSWRHIVDYCYSVSDMLSALGGSVQTVTFNP